jgi:hypothetical protein
LSRRFEDKDRDIFIAFGELDGYRVELVAPMGEGSPVDMYLSKIGPTTYHYLLSQLRH